MVRTHGQPPLQGYNAQAAVNEHQIIIAAEITVDSPDFGHLEPMVAATRRELHRHGLTDPLFGQIKFNRAIKRFQRRGRAACRSEWRLIAATHNLLKLHNHQIAAATP